jgi:hypothetical protein
MTKSKEYDFNALLATPSEDKLFDCELNMWIAALRVCPKWRRYRPSGNELVEWLYNYHPEKARAIEREHKLYSDDVAAGVASIPAGAAATKFCAILLTKAGYPP